MDKDHLKHMIQTRITEDGLMETGVAGVRLFRATAAVPCAPVVYEPCVIAIVSGAKEAVLDGERLVYDNSKYMCCPTSMPVKAGTPTAAPDNPLFGVIISLDQRVMHELTLEMENVRGFNRADVEDTQGIRLAAWDEGFTDALSRLLKLGGDETDTTVLGAVRLRELYYAILKGEAANFARRLVQAMRLHDQSRVCRPTLTPPFQSTPWRPAPI